MFKQFIFTLAMIATLTLQPFAAKAEEGQAGYEQHKISLLIQSIADSNATFVRNGLEYSSKEASEHMQHKLEVAGSRIATAMDFIEKLASRSYLTGMPYYVKFTDGTKVASHDWLVKKLYTIESTAKLKASSSRS